MGRFPDEEGGKTVMVEMTIGGIIGFLSLIYLFYALLYPEKL